MGAPVVWPWYTPATNATSSDSRRAVTNRPSPCRRSIAARSCSWSTASPAGTPSMVATNASPWDSPQMLTLNTSPSVFISHAAFGDTTLRRRFPMSCPAIGYALNFAAPAILAVRVSRTRRISRIGRFAQLARIFIHGVEGAVRVGLNGSAYQLAPPVFQRIDALPIDAVL